MRRSLVCLAVLAAVAAVRAEAPPDVTLAEVLKGQIAPLTIDLKDMDAKWFAFSASGTFTLPEMMAMMSDRRLASVYYSTGQTVTIAGETYLIAYQSRVDEPSAAMPWMSPPPPPPTSAKGPLPLSLLNLRLAGHLLDIHSADRQGEGVLSESLANLRLLAAAIHQYVEDSDEVMPPLENITVARRALLPYVRNGQAFTQPGANRMYLTNPLVSQRKLVHISNPEEMIVFYEAEPAPDGSVGAAFMDGHAERIPATDWELACRRSRLNEVTPMVEPGAPTPPPPPGARR